MIKKFCSACGKVCWHNPLATTKNKSPEYRCTYCGHPLGTGPKREKLLPIHNRQVAKAGRI